MCFLSPLALLSDSNQNTGLENLPIFVCMMMTCNKASGAYKETTHFGPKFAHIFKLGLAVHFLYDFTAIIKSCVGDINTRKFSWTGIN